MQSLKNSLIMGSVFIALALFTACSPSEKKPTEDVKQEIFNALYARDVDQLDKLAGNIDGVFTECEKNYFRALYEIQKLLKSLENLASNGFNTAAIQSKLKSQGYDLATIIHTYLDPYEVIFKRMRDSALYAYQNSCTFYTPKGVKFSFSSPISGTPIISEASFSVVLGYEWDEVEARVIYAFAEYVLSIFDFLYSHSFVIDVFSMPDLSGENNVEVMRKLGAIFAWNPRFLDFSQDADDRARFDRIDNMWLDALKAVHDPGNLPDDLTDDTGIVPYLFSRYRSDTDVTDNVVGFIDTSPTGKFSPGDQIILGVRSAKIGGMISIPSMEEGIVFTLNGSWAQVFDSVYSSFVSLMYKVERALEMVDAGVDHPVYVDASSINELLQGFSPVFPVPEVPNIIRLDITAFFAGPDYQSGPKPLRKLLPFWYNDDGDPTTPEEFMIEGESQIHWSAHVAGEDSEHFPTAIDFKGKTYTTRIPADGIGPDMVTNGPESTLIYAGFQDPTFNGLLYLDLSQLPYAPETGPSDFSPADLYSLNKLLAWLQAGFPGLIR